MTRDGDLYALARNAHKEVIAALTELGHCNDTTESAGNAARALARALANLDALKGEIGPMCMPAVDDEDEDDDASDEQ